MVARNRGLVALQALTILEWCDGVRTTACRTTVKIVELDG
jgi:hypothetical protein